MEDICDFGIRIAIVDGDRIYDSASLSRDIMTTFEILMKAKLAHDESQQKSQRISSAWRAKQAATRTGKIMTSRCPGWLEVQNDKLVPIPERVIVVQRIFEMASDGLGSKTIASALNEEGINSWNTKTHPRWSGTYIRDVITGSAVEGDYIPDYRSRSRPPSNERIPYFPRVIDADLVARARAALASHRGAAGKYLNNYANLFRGTVRCGVCGSNMTLSSFSKSAIGDRQDSDWAAGGFRCTNAVQKRGCTVTHIFNYRPFERAALDAVLKDALNDRFFQRPDRSNLLAIRVAELEKTIRDRTDATARLTDLLTQTTAVREIIEQLERVSQQRVQAERDLKEAQAALERERGAVDPHEHLQRVLEVRDSLTHDDEATRIAARRKVSEAIRAIVDQVICEPAEIVDSTPQKTITLVMFRGMVAHKFDIRGKLIASVDLTRELETSSQDTFAFNLRHAVTGSDANQEVRLQAFLNRRADAAG
jgi:hypothetical protein